MDNIILLRAAIVTAEANMLADIDHAICLLAEEYSGPPVSPSQVQHLKKALPDQIQNLNATLALYFTGYSDSNKIKYHSALKSICNIHQLIIDIHTDALMLSSSMDLEPRKKLLDNVQALLESIRNMCSLNMSDDREKMHEECYKYIITVEKILFEISKEQIMKTENQIIKLAWEVDDSSSHLLRRANVLRRQMFADSKVESLQSAIQRFVTATRDLLICTQLSAVAVHNTHYHRAIAAACETLTSCLNQLSATWKALVEDSNRYHLTYELHQYEVDIHKTVKKLKQAVLNKEPEEDCELLQDNKDLNLIANVDEGNMFDEQHEQINEPERIAVSIKPEETIRRRLIQRLTQLNAAVAMLTYVPQSNNAENTDDDMRVLAINLISQLIRQIFMDRRVVSRFRSEEVNRKRIQKHIFNLRDVTTEMINKNEGQANLVDCASKVYQISSELVFLVYPEKIKEKQLVNESIELRNIVLKMTSHFSEAAPFLVNKRNRCEIAARNNLTLTQITAPYLNDSRCGNMLSSAMEDLQESFNDLTASTPRQLIPDYAELLNEILPENLEFITQTLHDFGDGEKNISSVKHANQRQSFFNSLVDAGICILSTKQLVKKRKLSVERPEPVSAEIKRLLVEKLEQLKAAVAVFLLSFDNKNAEYTTAQRAVNIIPEIMPQILQDICELRESDDYYGIRQLIQQLLDASWIMFNVRQSIEYNDAEQAEVLSDAAGKFGEVSKKLMLRLNPAFNDRTLKKVIIKMIADLLATICKNASKLYNLAQAVLKQMPQGTNTELEMQGCFEFNTVQILLTAIAKVIASSINRTECLIVLMSATEHLRRSAMELISSCFLRTTPDNYKKLQIQLVQQQLEENLNKLVQFCRQSIAEIDTFQITRKHRFNDIISSTLKSITTYHKQINEKARARLQPCNLDDAGVKKLQCELFKKLEILCAANAALILAMCDSEDPDYTTGQSAVHDIGVSLSRIIKDEKQLRSFKNGSEQMMMSWHLQQLCKTSTTILLSSTDQTEDFPKVMHQFYAAYRDLMFYFDSMYDSGKSTNVSEAAYLWMKQLLTARRHLPGRLSDEMERMLKSQREITAQAILIIAHVTVPTKVASKYSSDVKSAAVHLRLSSIELTSAYCVDLASDEKTLLLSCRHQKLEKLLNEIIDACGLEQCQARLEEFIEQYLRDRRSNKTNTHILWNSLEQQKEGKLNQQLNKSVVADVNRGLLKRMTRFYTGDAFVNAALSDSEGLDQARAIFSSIILNIMPPIVQVAYTLREHVDNTVHERMLQQIDQIWDIIKAITSNIESNAKIRKFMSESEEKVLELRFLKNVRQFNVAVTVLVDVISDYEQIFATSTLQNIQDRVYTDYVSAQRAVSTITTLTPPIVQDADGLKDINDGATNQRVVQLVRKLYNACDSIYNNTDIIKVVKEAAATFNETFLKLKFAITTGGYKGPQQITELSTTAYTRASDLLSDVQEFTKQELDLVPVDVNDREANTFTAAQDLMNIAEKLVGDLSSTRCMISLESTVMKFRESAAELIASCTHIQSADKQRLRTLQEQLNDSLDLLLQACREAHQGENVEEKWNEVLESIKNLSEAEIDLVFDRLQLQQPQVFMNESNNRDLQLQLMTTLKETCNDIANLTDNTSNRLI